jgi:hypothetical protein
MLAICFGCIDRHSKVAGEAGVLARYLRSRVGMALRCRMSWRHLCEGDGLAGDAFAASDGYNDEVLVCPIIL